MVCSFPSGFVLTDSCSAGGGLTSLDCPVCTGSVSGGLRTGFLHSGTGDSSTIPASIFTVNLALSIWNSSSACNHVELLSSLPLSCIETDPPSGRRKTLLLLSPNQAAGPDSAALPNTITPSGETPTANGKSDSP